MDATGAETNALIIKILLSFIKIELLQGYYRKK